MEKLVLHFSTNPRVRAHVRPSLRGPLVVSVPKPGCTTSARSSSGSLFAIANLLISTVVNNLGLGVGFMLWSATNIAMGFVISRYGLFGVKLMIPSSPLFNELGILCMLVSIGVYGMIKPTLATGALVRQALGD